MDLPATAAQLRSILAALREDIKPELTTAQAKLRGELIDMLLCRITVEAETAALAAPVRADVGNLPAFAAAEKKRRGEFEDRVTAAGRGIAAGHRSAKELDISPHGFADYLRNRFPERPPASVTAVVPIPGGRSKATILVELSTEAGPQTIVIRKDFDIGVAGTSVTYEYPVVRAAWVAGLPVPEPLWLEEDAGVIGGKFIAFAQARGRPMGTLFQSDASPAFAKQLAITLARLHQIDIDAAGLTGTLDWADVPDPVTAMIESFHTRYRTMMRPQPLMDAAFAWLRAQLGAIGTHRALIHGDAALHNMMGDGDELTAMLDWEFTHAGDPAEDLAYCRFLVERVLPWDEFMAAYEAAGGQPVSGLRWQVYAVWRTLRLAIYTGVARALFESGEDQDLRIAAIGFNTFPKLLRALADDLAAVAPLQIIPELKP
jgi:aminoglycoside phosphotransferase (APT) family kinase protein